MYPTFGVLGGVSGKPVSYRAPSPTKMKESSSNIMGKTLCSQSYAPLCYCYVLCTLAVPVWSGVVIVWWQALLWKTGVQVIAPIPISFNLYGHMQCDHTWSSLPVVCNNVAVA